MNHPDKLVPLALFLFSPACFAPHAPIGHADDGNDGDSTGSDSTTTTSASSDSASSDDGATEPAETSQSATGSASASETDASSSDAGDESSTGTYPSCGDGHVDDGEECDDGDAIGPDSHCLEGCVLNVCGDGQLDPELEACDDGEDANVLEVGACAPDCSRVIEEKVIVSGDYVLGGDFGNNPVAFADSTCSAGYSAMFVVTGIREASASPYEGDAAVDWVLEPYTAYTTVGGTLIWITDETPLLGVRDGVNQPVLTAPIVVFANVHDPGAITGMNANWTAMNSNTCNGWTSASAAQMARRGNPTSTTAYLSANTIECSTWSTSSGFNYEEATSFYCVEQ